MIPKLFFLSLFITVNLSGISQDVADTCKLNMPDVLSVKQKETPTLLTPQLNCPVYKYKLEVYNRWGELMFSSDDINKNWSVAEVKDGVYFYMVEFGFSETDIRNLKGTVHIFNSIEK